MHEKQTHRENVYLTLTVSDNYLDAIFPGASLAYRPYQLFMKKLRRHAQRMHQAAVRLVGPLEARGLTPIRFYMCGEYGEQCRRCGASNKECQCGDWTPGPGRPHYHALLFGWDFKDKFAFKKGDGGHQLWRSPSLEQLWPYGHASLGDVTYESAAYVARYIVKKLNGQLAKAHYELVNPDTGEITNRKPEFTRMSLRQGLGADWLHRYWEDVYPQGTVIVNGHEQQAPKYYDKLFKRRDRRQHAHMVDDRVNAAAAKAADNTPARLADKEAVLTARTTKLKRNKL